MPKTNVVHLKIKYIGPGNSWRVRGMSKLTGKYTQIHDVKFRTACTFIKTHRKSN